MCPYDSAEVVLGGLEAGKLYEFTNLDSGDVTRYAGEALQAYCKSRRYR